MSTSASSKPNPKIEARLEQIRGRARRRTPTVRTLAQYSANTDCALANLGFAAQVDFDRLLRGTPFAEPFGQSPFAFRRGIQFENQLRERGYEKTLRLLRERMNFRVDDAKIENLRKRFAKSREGNLKRAEATRSLVEQVLNGTQRAPNLIDGAVLTASVGGIQACFEADAVAARFQGPIHVGEVKSFPIVDGRIDANKLGTALDQVSIYLLLLEELVASLGGKPDEAVSKTAMLITPRNVGLTPELSVKDVTSRMIRVKRLLDQAPRAADLATAYSADVTFDAVGDVDAPPEERVAALEKVADRVGTKYSPSCFDSCGNARFCRERAFRSGNPCLAGNTALRLLPGVETLTRVAELSRGGTPRREEEKSAPLLAQAGRLFEKFAEPAVAQGTASVRRR